MDLGINVTTTKYTNSVMKKIKNKNKDMAHAFASVLASGYAYNIHFKEGIDWDHLLLIPAVYTSESDKTIVLRFNYTKQRELFDIKAHLNNKIGRFMR